MKLCLLWHMHQPDYRRPGGGGFAAMPWTRLHAAKDYVDVVELATRRPEVRPTVNLVPVLAEQLDDVARGGSDPLLALSSKPPEELRDEEHLLLLRYASHVRLDRMLPRSARFAALERRRAELAPDRGALLHGFGPQDLLDLQVLLHLAWTGPLLRREPAIAELLERDGPFTIADRDALLDRLRRRAGEVVPRYAELARAGRMELSATPLCHPILPLLCDLETAELARPGCSVDGLRFRRPEDAERQVVQGLDVIEARTGLRPVGMWPSEGALSEEALEILGRAGLRWAATDRALLGKSLEHPGAADHLRPWRLRDGPAVFFRDTELSDRIGFVYADWPAEAAARDFVEQARALAARADEPERAVVCVFLDGENCWEHYEGGGEPFLVALTDALAEADDIEAVTLSEALDAWGEPSPLPRLRPGSWIRGDLDTWAGHPDKNHAWALLVEAREEFEAWLPGRSVDEVEAARAHLLRAEGSDWFWWLGDDHPTDWLAEFESAFRAHLTALYRAMGISAPPAFYRPISLSGPRPAQVPPTGPLRLSPNAPALSELAWLGAGRIQADYRAGAMHAGIRSPLRELRWAFDEDHLYLRLEAQEDRPELLRGRVRVLLNGDEASPRRLAADRPTTWTAALERSAADLRSGRRFTLRVEVTGPDGAVHSVPHDGHAELVAQGPEDWLKAWTV